jgi:hypothetical protein
MTTEKQIIANRLNGLKGGVKTDAGKQAVRLNAVSDGIFCRENVLPTEDAALLDSLSSQFMQQFDPIGEMETVLVERIISSTWRLKRVLRSDARLSSKYLLKNDDTAEPNGGIDYRYNTWQNLAKYETTIERQIYRAMNALERIQRTRMQAANLAASLDIADDSDSDCELNIPGL